MGTMAWKSEVWRGNTLDPIQMQRSGSRSAKCSMSEEWRLCA